MKIIAPKDSYYCVDFMSEIPTGIVSKQICGCGMTTVALENNKPTVVCVPNTEVILNKVGQYPNDRRKESVFGVYAGVDVKAKLLVYLDSATVPKIMVTYDSFYKLMPYVDDSWTFIVDEFSDLLDVYNYRDKAVRRLLKDIKNYTNVSYVSATPIKPEYYPDELVGLPYTEIEWQDIVRCQVIRKPTDQPYKAAACIIAKYIMAGKEGVPMPNGYNSKAALFFVNSVTAIKQLITKTKLQPNQVRIICADTEQNRKKLGRAYKIKTALDPEPLITFTTSKAFKGSDYYSDSGVVYIVSNTHNLNTLVSIDTDAVQISGRIRTLTNPFRHVIFHIYNTDPSLLCAEEFEALVDKKIKTTDALLSGFSRLVTCEEKAGYINLYKTQDEEAKDNHYVMVDDNDTPIFNRYMIKNDRRRWETSHNVYVEGSAIRQAYLQAGFDVPSGEHIPSTKFSQEFLDYLSTMDYKEKCTELIEKKEEVQDYFAKFAPDILEAHELLGAKKMRALGLNPTRIRKAVEDARPETQQELQAVVYQNFTKGSQYTLKEAKTKLQGIYDSLGISSKAKATDLSRWFVTTQKNIKNTLYILLA